MKIIRNLKVYKREWTEQMLIFSQDLKLGTLDNKICFCVSDVLKLFGQEALTEIENTMSFFEIAKYRLEDNHEVIELFCFEENIEEFFSQLKTTKNKDKSTLSFIKFCARQYQLFIFNKYDETLNDTK